MLHWLKAAGSAARIGLGHCCGRQRQYVTLQSNRNLTYVTTISILRWRSYSILSLAQWNHKSPYKREAGGSRSFKDYDVLTEEEGEGAWKMHALALKMENKIMSQGV